MIRTTIAALALVAAGGAQAATYDWSYRFDTGTPQVLAGVIEGTALAGGPQVAIDSILDVTLNGAAFGGPLTAVNNAQWWYGGVGTAYTSVDGSIHDFCVSAVGVCEEDGFLFDAFGATGNFALFADEPRTLNHPGFGPFDAYDAAGWSMTLRTAEVPLPAGLGLLAMALAGLAGLARRRAA